jgi:hypothetical protein
LEGQQEPKRSEENKDEDENSDTSENSRRRRCLSVKVITSRTFKCEAERCPFQAHSYALTQMHPKTSGSVDDTLVEYHPIDGHPQL